MSSRMENFLINQKFIVDSVETTISKGMCTSFKVDVEDLKRIEETTSKLEEEKLFELPSPRSISCPNAGVSQL